MSAFNIAMKVMGASLIGDVAGEVAKKAFEFLPQGVQSSFMDIGASFGITGDKVIGAAGDLAEAVSKSYFGDVTDAPDMSIKTVDAVGQARTQRLAAAGQAQQFQLPRGSHPAVQKALQNEAFLEKMREITTNYRPVKQTIVAKPNIKTPGAALPSVKSAKKFSKAISGKRP